MVNRKTPQDVERPAAGSPPCRPQARGRLAQARPKTGTTKRTIANRTTSKTSRAEVWAASGPSCRFAATSRATQPKSNETSGTIARLAKLERGIRTRPNWVAHRAPGHV